MQAFAEGKPIQDKIEGVTDWVDTDEINLEFEGQKILHRIKPDQKCRPFKNQKECWQEMLKHHPFGWVKDIVGNKFIIETINSDGSIYVSDEGTCYFSEALENYTFDDGIPFGVKAEE